MTDQIYYTDEGPRLTPPTQHGQISFFIIIMLLGYFFLSGFTQSIGSSAGQGLAGRLIPADVYMFFLALFGLASIRRVHLPAEYAAYIPFFLISGLTGIGSYIPRQAAIELMVHIWAWLGSLIIFNIMAKAPEASPPLALRLLLYTSTVLALLGFIHLFFLPSLFDVRAHGGVVGSFRNAGQSGSYMGMVLAVIIPGMLCGMIKPTWTHFSMVAIIIASLIFSTKRAAMIGLGLGYIGVLFLLIVYGGFKYKKLALQLLFATILLIPIIYLGIEWGKENIEKMAYRLEHKLGEGALDKFSNNFFNENIGGAFDAVNDAPFFGVGMGNIAGVYTAKYEIHSTYFKIMATGGLFGSIAYIIFMGTLAKSVLTNIGTKSREALFLLYFSPFLAGLVVSWIYTYHLRKREFWIIFAIVILISKVAAIKKQNARQNFIANY